MPETGTIGGNVDRDGKFVSRASCVHEHSKVCAEADTARAFDTVGIAKEFSAVLVQLKATALCFTKVELEFNISLNAMLNALRL